jgi:Flp pilus assembly CpaE family ATPase
LREAADAGRTVFEAAPGSEAASALHALAERVQSVRQGQIRKALTLLS